MSRPSARAAAFALAILLAAPVVLADPEEGSAAASCPAGLREMEDVGTVCPRDDGLFEVFSPDMTSMGYIHGSDPVPTEPDALPDVRAATTPRCVSGAPGTYYVQVIYARASNDLDQYAAWVGAIRKMVESSNALVDAAAAATGSTAQINVKCVNGQIEVKNEALPTLAALANFGTITGDLNARGYNNGKVKYWIFYDDTGACTCGGQGNVQNDDRLTLNNANNGNAGPMYAINYGYDSTRIWLHELGHNLGAVQLSAPYSSGGWHCNDGRDTMCYNDGGSNSSGYSNAYCAVEIWDCGKNSYFHAKPPIGSYLSTHWNLGNAINRFFTMGTPSLASLTCAPTLVELGNATTCAFLGYDDSAGVRYRIDWGDGLVEYVPSATTYATPGVEQSAPHTYASAAAFDITATITDATGATGNSLAARVTVRDDLVPPEVSVQEPRRAIVYDGCDRQVPVPFNVPRPVWVDTACVKATATDARSAITRVDVFVAGVLRMSDTTAPYEFEFPVPRSQLNVPVFVYAYDAAGNRGYEALSVDMVGTG